MSISEEKQSPPGGPAVEHQKICMPPRQNFQQNSGASIASATTSQISPEVKKLWRDSLKAIDTEYSSASDLSQKRAQCSAGAHEWDHKTHRCIHCQTPVTSFMLQPATVNTVSLTAPPLWPYPTSRYSPGLQKISQRQTTDATVETEAAKLRREVASLQARVAQLNQANLRLMSQRDSLHEQNRAQATLIAGMSGEQVADTDGLFKARVEAAAVAAVDEPVNVEKAAQDTLDAMVARKLSRGMTEKLRDTAVESLRKGDRDASVGRAIGARFGGGLRQPW